MANEAVLLAVNGAIPIDMPCSDAVAIEKGCILKMSATDLVAPSAAAGDVVAGIAAAEKVANDGSTRIPVYMPGCGAEFDLTCGAVGATLGYMVRISGANLIGDAAATDAELGKQLGKALEAGGASEVIRVLL